LHNPSHREALLFALGNIPGGRVISYGQLARLAGRPGAARWVGNQLRQLPQDSTLPWHRVVNSRGEISLPKGSPGYDEQVRRLEREGITCQNGKIDLLQSGWP
jgi:methylated-DNA-protein-cysteine methyltransferase-like protein